MLNSCSFLIHLRRILNFQECSMQDNYFIQRAFKSIDHAAYVSFDIFDTLLLRPYVSPKDLFLHIEEQHKRIGFRDERVLAERRARKKNPNQQDITFDEIYREIQPKYLPLKQVELDLEYQVLLANPEMKVIWDYAIKQNKPIIICTDMYLSREFLISVLTKNGFIGFEKLYISGELGKTKKTGALFEFVLNDLNLDPKKIVHIGDNKKGDFKSPMKFGIECLLYTQIFQQFIQFDSKANRFHQSKKSLGQSILLSMQALAWLHRCFTSSSLSYWEEIGYDYAGPLAYGFATWIEQQAKQNHIDHILFVARDGNLIRQAFAQIHQQQGIKHSYVYAPRLLNLICRLDYSPHQFDQAQVIVEYYVDKYAELERLTAQQSFVKAEDYHRFIQTHLTTFERYADIELRKYQHYINSLVEEDQRIAMVDTKTIAFTSQKLIEATLGKSISGFYWSTLLKSDSQIFDYQEFVPNTFQRKDIEIFTENWKFVELMLSSPEPAIQGVSEIGMPLYKKNLSQSEIDIMKNIEQIHLGASQFNQDIQTYYGDYQVRFSPADLVTLVNIFCEMPDAQDFAEMNQIKVSADVAHNHHQPLFSVHTTTKDWFTHPRATLQLVKAAKWRTCSQTIILNICKFYKIRRKKKEFLSINFLPYLKVQYFMSMFRLTKKFKLYFLIGKNESM